MPRPKAQHKPHRAAATGTAPNAATLGGARLVVLDDQGLDERELPLPLPGGGGGAGGGGGTDPALPSSGDPNGAPGIDFVIGRAADCDLILTDPSVSKHHAALRLTATEVLLVDLGSSNGTFLNGRRIIGPEPLRSGDVLVAGDTEVRFDGARPGPRRGPERSGLNDPRIVGEDALERFTTARPRTVLLSHAPEDRQAAEMLVLHLQRAGHLIWIDRAVDGDGWGGGLLDAIWSCDAVLFLVSAAAADCERVQREVHLAGAERTPVLPLILEPAELPEDLAWYLAQRRPIDLRFDVGGALDEILVQLERLPRKLVARPLRLLGWSVATLMFLLAATYGLRWLVGG